MTSVRKPDDTYEVHLISFRNLDQGGCNVITRGGGNIQPWHIPLLEKFVEDMKRKLKGGADDFDDLC